jgi:hypothetical protein
MQISDFCVLTSKYVRVRLHVLLTVNLQEYIISSFLKVLPELDLLFSSKSEPPRVYYLYLFNSACYQSYVISLLLIVYLLDFKWPSSPPIFLFLSRLLPNSYTQIKDVL